MAPIGNATPPTKKKTEGFQVRRHRRLPWKPKGKKARTLPLPPDLHGFLSELRDRAPKDVPYIFLSRPRYLYLLAKKLPETPRLLSGVLKHIQRIQVLAKMDQATLHEMRHSRITAWAGKLSPREVQLMAGHESLTTTLGIYTHVQNQEVVDRVKKELWRETEMAYSAG